ncbi:hypothetical protein QOZ80_1BG0049060 [Eleusine coracana subsp. coracana]|nr:hypothetical protein QOZ80_1BG0049060 [Eleusine coracana subsp. coracana]
MPPGFGPPSPPPPAGTPAPLRSAPSPEGSRSERGGRFVEHLVGGDLAGVPAELLPLKKRIVRYHPYAAAWPIQEMASLRGGSGWSGDLRRREKEADEDGGLRAQLLRLRITRPSLLLTKQLTLSDRNPGAGRLVLPERLVRASPLLGMLTAAERRLAFGRRGLPVPAFDRLGRAYRMTLRRDRSAGTFHLKGNWTLYLSRHDVRAGDAVEVLAFRPSAWQARLDRHGEAGLGMALLHLHCPDANRTWTNRERDAADVLLLIASSCRLTSSANGFESTRLVVSNLVEVR